MRKGSLFGGFAAVSMPCLLAIAGCVSAWETHFVPANGTLTLAEDTGRAAQIRRVPWDRLNSKLVELERQVETSDVHPSEWPRERLAARDAEVLRALQISENPARTRILGRSVFRSTSPISPNDGALGAFAEKIGADYAVWASRYEGKTLVTEREAVTTQGFVWDGYRDRRGFGQTGYQETTYVPVVVEADEYAWVAYFIRLER